MKILKLMLVTCLIGISPYTYSNSNQATIDQVKPTVITSNQIANAILLEKKNDNTDAFIGTEEWENLDCTRLIEKLNRTQTNLGAVTLNNLFMPVSEIKEIKSRQLMVKMLNNSPSFKASITNKLNIIKPLESDILSVFNSQDTLHASIAQAVNFRWIDSLNKDKLALTLSAGWVIYKSAIGIYSALFSNQLMHEIDKQLEEKKFTFKGAISTSKSAFINALKSPIVWHNPFPNVFKDGYSKEKLNTSNPLSHSMGDVYVQMQERYHFKDRAHIGKAISVLSAAGYVLSNDYAWGTTIFSAINTIKQNYNFFNALKKRVANINTVLKTAKDLYKTQNMFVRLCAHQAGLNLDKINKLDKYILDLGNKMSVNNRLSGFLWSGAACAAYNELFEKRAELLPLFKFIGLIDAYNSISTLSKEMIFGNMWCFPDFVNSNTPSISLTNSWLPLVVGKSIPNSIDLSSAANGIFTGPNGSGKSTIMKAMAFSIMLGQSWGIVPASEAKFTRFSGIKTYLNIKEDLSHGKSQFMKETEKMRDILAYASNLNSDRFGFILIDEPLTGTIEIEAAQRTHDFGLALANNPYVSSIIATHLEKPIYLEETNKFKNFHLDIIESPNDKSFIKTFKLREGAAYWWFKDADKRQRFVDWLSENL